MPSHSHQPDVHNGSIPLAASPHICFVSLPQTCFVMRVQVPHLLQWAQGKSIVMLCVKEPRDIARAITTIIDSNATDRTFLELRSHFPSSLFYNTLQTIPKPALKKN
jgi:hypothetical protein